jgi:hypothetical protein
MAFDYAVLGKKLKDARESLSISPDSSASRLQLSLNEYTSNVHNLRFIKALKS